MSLSWTHQIAKSLASERPSLALELHLDALLVWLSNPDNPRATELDQAIGQRTLSRAEANASAYRLLDQQLFASDDPPLPEILGFDAGAPTAVAKQRYRRLVQVYHPDRHPERTDWATRRTEQINRTFAAFQRGERGSARVGPHKQQPRSGTVSKTWSHWRLPPTWLADGLRDPIAPAWVWVHDRIVALTPLQQRLLSIAAIAGALMLAIALWPAEPPKPVPRIVHHPLGIEPTPAPAAAPVSGSGIESRPPEHSRRLAAGTPAPDAGAAQPDSSPSKHAPADSRGEAGPVASQPRDSRGHGSTAVSEPSWQEAVGQQNRATLVAPATAEPEPSRPLEAAAPQSAPWPAPVPTDLPTMTEPDSGASSASRAAIPAATTPQPPKAPTPPEAPLALGAIPAVSTAKPTTLASAPIEIRCQAAPDILGRFQSAYQNGALDQLMTLYSPLAKENDLATWFAIRQTYTEWFRTTSARRITFEQIQIQPVADSHRCTLMAVFQVSYLDRQSRLVTQAGIIELLLEHKGADWSILRARY